MMKLELVTCTLDFREISFSLLCPLLSWPFPSLFLLFCPGSSFLTVFLILTRYGVKIAILLPQPLSARVILRGGRRDGVSLPPPSMIMSLYGTLLLYIPKYSTLSFWTH